MEGAAHAHLKTLSDPDWGPFVSGALATGTNVVVTAVDGNPRYTGAAHWWFRFWEAIAARLDHSIVPVLLTVGEPQIGLPPRFADHVVPLPHYPGLPTAFVAQTARVVWPATLIGRSDSRILTTDVDMMPLSRRFFQGLLAHSGSEFVVGRDVLSSSGEFPICYLSATGTTWRSVVGPVLDLGEHLRNVLQAYGPYSGHHGGVGWSIDQRFIFDRATAWADSGGHLTRLADSETKHHRLDRRWPRAAAALGAPLLPLQFFTDYHAHVPMDVNDRLPHWMLRWL